MIKELVLDLNHTGYHNAALKAVLRDESVVVVDAWFTDERNCHIREEEYSSWIDKDVNDLKELVSERDIRYVQSWV